MPGIIDNSSLTNNKAHDLGGAIYALGSVTVNNSNVSQNSVSHYEGKRMAGAIYAEGNVIIENSTVSGLRRGPLYSGHHCREGL